MVKQAVSKLHSLVTQTDIRCKEEENRHVAELRDLQNFNQIQADRIKALTVALDN